MELFKDGGKTLSLSAEGTYWRWIANYVIVMNGWSGANLYFMPHDGSLLTMTYLGYNSTDFLTA